MTTNPDKKYALDLGDLHDLIEVIRECRGDVWFSASWPHEYEHMLRYTIIPQRKEGDVYLFDAEQIKAFRGAVRENNVPMQIFKKYGSYTHPDALLYHMDPALADATRAHRRHWERRLDALLDIDEMTEEERERLSRDNRLRRDNAALLRQQDDDEWNALSGEEQARIHRDAMERIAQDKALIDHEMEVIEAARKRGVVPDVARTTRVEVAQRRIKTELELMKRRNAA